MDAAVYDVSYELNDFLLLELFIRVYFFAKKNILLIYKIVENKRFRRPS